MSEATGDILLSLRRTSKSFGTAAAHASTDFTLRNGEFPAVCGENGADRSILAEVRASTLTKVDDRDILASIRMTGTPHEGIVRAGPQHLADCVRVHYREEPERFISGTYVGTSMPGGMIPA
jgi:ABC-type branched-subunit amino acid transport system ATPase component